MKNVYLFLIALLVMFIPSAATAADWSYDFENARDSIGKNFHDHSDVHLNGLTWKIYCVRNNDNSYDWADGKGSARIYGTKASADDMPYFEMKDVKAGGIGTVSFDYRAYADHEYSQTEWIVQVTTDDGEHWKTVGQPFTPSMDVQHFEGKASAANGRVRIVRADFDTFDWKDQGFTGAFNIDNLSITDFIQLDPNAAAIETTDDRLQFGTVYKGESSTLPLEVNYRNLKDAITVSLTGDATFSVDQSTIDVGTGTNAATLNITFAPTGYGERSATLTLTSGDATATVLLKGQGARKPGVYTYSGGSGTEESPYLLSTATDIEDLSAAVEEGFTYENKFFSMTQDIDMTDVTGMHPIGNNFGSDGTNVKPFSGTFDGNGHTISHLTLSFTGKDYIGVALFGVTQNATIKNLTLDESTISADAVTAGIAAAMMGGTITNCHVGAGVQVTSRLQAYAGGVACGVLSSPVAISDCSSRATVSCPSMGVAGILANNGVAGSTIERCVNYGALSADMGTCGGIVGIVEGDGTLTVEDCANFGNIDTPENAGGIAGLMSPDGFGSLTIKNSYSSATVSATSNVHPITLTHTGDYTTINIDNCYYNSDLYTADADGVTAKTSADMRTDAFRDLLNNGRQLPWQRRDGINSGYPLPTATAIPDHGAIVADNVVVPVNSYYRMFMTAYGKKTQEYADSLKRFVVKYESDNEDVVAGWGNSFKCVGTGEANMKMRLSKPLPGTSDKFDESQLLDEFTFKATVEEDVDPAFPELNTSWGASLAETMSTEEALGYKPFSDEYWTMHPTIDEDSRKDVEVFSTGNFEFPLLFAYFNSQDQLLGTDMIVSSWERIKTPQINAVSKHLKTLGYTYVGLDEETNQWEMYNKETKSIATCGMVFIQNQSYYYLSLLYEPNDPTGISDVLAAFPNVDIRTSGNMLTIDAKEHAGEPVVITNIAGQRLAASTLHKGANSFRLPASRVVMVKVGSCKAVKVVL